jgi:hypothetical protein
VKVEEDTVMKAISPGDRVDVNVYLRKNQEVPKTGVFTILKNVRIFAVNTTTERTPSESETGKPQTASFRTVSLLVKQEQARDLNLAAQVGKILLTLRRPDDDDKDVDENMTPIDELLGGSSVASEPVRSGSNTLGGGFLETVNGGGHRGGNAAKSIIIYGPNGAEQFDWYDVNHLPVKSQATGVTPFAPTPGSTDGSTPTTPPDGPSPATNWLD